MGKVNLQRFFSLIFQFPQLLVGFWRLVHFNSFGLHFLLCIYADWRIQSVAHNLAVLTIIHWIESEKWMAIIIKRNCPSKFFTHSKWCYVKVAQLFHFHIALDFDTIFHLEWTLYNVYKKLNVKQIALFTTFPHFVPATI